MAARLADIVRHCGKRLQPDRVTDSDRAHNGLQVENSGRVTRIAATVDASLATIEMAIAAKADLLIVHHGLFWSPTVPWTGKRRAMLKLLLENDLAVYSSHLPLDLHPELGNNAQICAKLGFKKIEPFFMCHGQTVGFKTRHKISRRELSARLAKILGGHAPHLLPGGPEQCENIGVVSGGAGDDFTPMVEAGLDTYISGEGPHQTHAMAEFLELNVFYGGHYLTETFGVKALAAELSKKFRVPWEFLDHPSGL